MLAFDVRLDAGGTPCVAIHGWRDQSTLALWTAVDHFAASGLAHVLCTDVSRDGALTGPNVELYAEAVRRFPTIAWQASGANSVDRLIRGTGSVIDARGVALYKKLVSSPKHVAAALGMMANWQLEPLLRDLPRLKPKLLLVNADNDKSVSPQVAWRVRQIVPKSEIEVLHGLGHLAHEERPDAVAALIIKSVAQANSAGETTGDV